MAHNQDPIVIIGSSCRLPGGVRRTSEVWDAFNSGEERLSSTTPRSRYFSNKPLFDANTIGKTGWIGDDGVLTFDPSFFNITPAEASALRPNTRLALELTWEALEVAGIPPSSLKGKNVAVDIGVGTEDGWDMKRYAVDKEKAFDMHWAASSDPSGVSGHVSHFFDFRGPSTVVSSACSSAAFALQNGVNSIINDGCDVAIVGGLTTHLCPAPFHWGTAVNVVSRKGHCAAFSSEADGYVPSEGAVFFVLRRLSAAQQNRNPILCVVKSIATGHSGSTRSLAIPNGEAQEAVCRKALFSAGLNPSVITFVEAHGTGTRIGDAIELESIRNVYGNASGENTIWLSSSKTVFGHCQAASAFVGILKVLSSIQHRAIPPHGVEPLPELSRGKIQIPTVEIRIGDSTPIAVQVNSFGFTGSIASIILEEPPKREIVEPFTFAVRSHYFLPFSAKSTDSLISIIREVCDWAIKTECKLYELGVILSLSRDHHAIRRGVILSDASELLHLHDDPLNYRPEILPAQSTAEELLLQLLVNHSHNEYGTFINLSAEKSLERAAATLYELGKDLNFAALYDITKSPRHGEYLQSFPTYPFNRRMCWKDEHGAHNSSSEALSTLRPTPNEPVNKQRIIEIIADIVNASPNDIPGDVSIFDLGIDSISSIELADTLTHSFGSQISITDIYSLLTVDAIYNHLSMGRRSMVARKLTQSDVELLVQTYGAPIHLSSSIAKSFRVYEGRTVLLTGGNGKLGCHLLNRLLLDTSNSRIFCLVRGEPWDRLSSAFAQRGYDLKLLSQERAAGRLIVFNSKALDDKDLGCSHEDYGLLLNSIDTIIHAAWRLDFNLPVAGFVDCLSGTRNLAELSVRAVKKVSYFFLSSYSSYFRYRDTLLPEEPLSPLLEYSLDQGYAVSKLVAEHALISLIGHHPDLFNLRIVRIGQICGDSVTGDWTQDEMVPMIIKSAPFLNAVLKNVPDASWIPSDVCADVVHDLISLTFPTTLKVLHVANPSITPWRDVIDTISSLLDTSPLPLLMDNDYVEAVQKAGKNVPIRRLMPYLLHVINHGGFPSRYCSLDVQETLKLSRALQLCPKIDRQFLSPIVAFLIKKKSSSPIPSPLRSAPAPVLIFGPWSNVSESAIAHSQYSLKIATLLQGLVSDSRYTIGYQDPDHSLERQIQSLTIQLSIVEQLASWGIQPVAVLGYCFGEFAAAIAAGILSESEVVEMLVRRAAALRKVSGRMLNVFEEETVVKRVMLRLEAPPDLAILAGPMHTVLSGIEPRINTAHKLFQAQGIKCKLVPTSLPFHSSVMDGVIKRLELPTLQPKRGKCIYVSGLLGGPTIGSNLGRAYWLRHMRDPVRFYAAMQYLRGKFSAHPLYNCGPGPDLISVFARCKWDDIHVRDTTETCVPASKDKENSDEPSKVEPEKKDNENEKRTISVEDEALAILTSTFLYPHKVGLLSRTFLDLGLQSMDFMKFTDLFKQNAGLIIPASSYLSAKSIKEVISSLSHTH